jgi:hypothetical protein
MVNHSPLHPAPPNMDNQSFSPAAKPDSLRPNTLRQRSNSFPIVEALGCSTPEAQLLLAEGRAAVRRRRAHRRHNRSFNDEDTTTYHPKDHLRYLDESVVRPVTADASSCHARVPSNITVRSTSTIVAHPYDADSSNNACPTSPLGNYSARLAQFIKAQLNSIPTYQPEHDSVSALSPQSCPEFSFPVRTPPLSPRKTVQRSVEAPNAINIPPVRPPMISAFSAWSSADDDDNDMDDDAPSLPDIEPYMDVMSKASTYAPSLLGYYETSNNASFFLSSTPLEEYEEYEEAPDTAKGHVFPDGLALASPTPEAHNDDDYPSSSMSQPQLSTSAPSFSSSSASASESSYFDYKRPLAIDPRMKERIVAALTPPHGHTQVISAISPWEGGALANVHDVYVESQQRVHVDGMSFDMLRDFTVPGRVSTPC